MDFINSMHKLFGFDRELPILFNSGIFLLFFTVFILVYAFVYKRKWLRNLYVISFSLFFYYKLSGWFLFALLFTTSADFAIALFIQKNKNIFIKRLLVAVSLIFSLGLLIYFKYTNFFLQGLYAISGNDFNALHILFPIGISFYIFRSISYILDVYKSDLKAEKNYLDYLFYMTFFPMLIAGPITRARDFLPRLKRKIVIRHYDISKGLFLIIQGLIKKAIIADYLAQYNNLVFASPETYSGFENMMAVYGFAIQLYFDFSGYTDMAMGLAKIMGFNIDQNFNKPYHAMNVTDFWRRWHLTLSSWLRDYLFTPLSLKLRNWGKTGIISSLMITFLICGLWHGASMTYVVWGGLMGMAMVWDAVTKKVRTKIRKQLNKKVYDAISILLTFHFIAFCWVFFRADDFHSAFTIFGKIFGDFSWDFLNPFLSVRGLFVGVLFAGIALYVIPHKIFSKITQGFYNVPYLVKVIIFLIVLQLIIQLQSAEVQQFIYAQF